MMADAIVKVEYDHKCKVTQTIDVGIDGATNQDHTLEIAGLSGTLEPTTTVPATLVWKDQRAVTTSETLDLTALARANLPNIDMSGLKVQFIVILAATGNTNAITFADGAVNGYNIFGDGSGQVTLNAGQIIMQFGNDKLDNVAAADLAIDVTCTGSQTYDILIVAG